MWLTIVVHFRFSLNLVPIHFVNVTKFIENNVEKFKNFPFSYSNEF